MINNKNNLIFIILTSSTYRKKNLLHLPYTLSPLLPPTSISISSSTTTISIQQFPTLASTTNHHLHHPYQPNHRHKPSNHYHTYCLGTTSIYSSILHHKSPNLSRQACNHQNPWQNPKVTTASTKSPSNHHQFDLLKTTATTNISQFFISLSSVSSPSHLLFFSFLVYLGFRNSVVGTVVCDLWWCF